MLILSAASFIPVCPFWAKCAAAAAATGTGNRPLKLAGQYLAANFPNCSRIVCQNKGESWREKKNLPFLVTRFVLFVGTIINSNRRYIKHGLSVREGGIFSTFFREKDGGISDIKSYLDKDTSLWIKPVAPTTCCTCGKERERKFTPELPISSLIKGSHHFIGRGFVPQLYFSVG